MFQVLAHADADTGAQTQRNNTRVHTHTHTFTHCKMTHAFIQMNHTYTCSTDKLCRKSLLQLSRNVTQIKAVYEVRIFEEIMFKMVALVHSACADAFV